jgi:hypothetical protein
MYARRAIGSVIINRGTCVVNTVATTLPIVLLLAIGDEQSGFHFRWQISLADSLKHSKSGRGLGKGKSLY